MAKKNRSWRGADDNNGPTTYEDASVKSRGMKAESDKGARFLDYPARDGESLEQYARKTEHVRKTARKERNIADANEDDRIERKQALQYATRAKQKPSERAIEANERIKERSKLQGPGYKCGGKVKKMKTGGKVKKCKHQSI